MIERISERYMFLAEYDCGCSNAVLMLNCVVYCQEYMALNRRPSFSLSFQILYVDPLTRAEPSVRLMSRWFPDTVDITCQKCNVGRKM